jgi:hypothetical protein
MVAPLLIGLRHGVGLVKCDKTDHRHRSRDGRPDGSSRIKTKHVAQAFQPEIITKVVFDQARDQQWFHSVAQGEDGSSREVAIAQEFY